MRRRTAAAVLAVGTVGVVVRHHHHTVRPGRPGREAVDAAPLARVLPVAVSRNRPLPSPATVAPATTTTAGRRVTTTTAHAYQAGWENLVAELFGPSAFTAFRVVHCESGGDPNAYNRSSGATGLFQVLGGSFDPDTNIREAYQMWRSRGWEPWDSSRGCWAA